MAGDAACRSRRPSGVRPDSTPVVTAAFFVSITDAGLDTYTRCADHNPLSNRFDDQGEEGGLVAGYRRRDEHVRLHGSRCGSRAALF